VGPVTACWVILFAPKSVNGRVFGRMRFAEDNELAVYTRIEEAREHKETMDHKWPHMKHWIVELDFAQSTN